MNILTNGTKVSVRKVNGSGVLHGWHVVAAFHCTDSEARNRLYYVVRDDLNHDYLSVVGAGRIRKHIEIREEKPNVRRR